MRLPVYELRQTVDHGTVIIRAVTKVKAWRKPDPVTDYLNAHRSVPGEIGFIEIFQYGDRKGTAVGKSLVREELRRSGLGTKLYEAAARAACDTFGQPLQSDYKRTSAAQKFWEKQVRKKRATCIRKERTAADDRRASPERSIVGRGGCGVYRLKSCPAPASLAGRKQ